MRKPVTVVGAVVLAVALGGCGGSSDAGPDSRTGTDSASKSPGLHVMVPNSAGSGYDLTARATVEAMSGTGPVEVFNIPGAGGTVGLEKLVKDKGNGDLMMMMGLGVVGSVYTNKSSVTLTDTTPLARLIEEAGAIVVPKDSPYRSVNDLVRAWKANSAMVTVGGGSAAGGPDHLLSMQFAQAVGINPKRVNYIAYDGGGELMPALLDRKVSFGVSGYSEFLDQISAGKLRIIATTGAKELSVVDAPTLKASGVNLVFTNWRGMVAPPGIDKAAETRLLGILDQLHKSASWKDALAKNDWTDAYMTGQTFKDFLTEQDDRVADILTRAGISS